MWGKKTWMSLMKSTLPTGLLSFPFLTHSTHLTSAQLCGPLLNWQQQTSHVCTKSTDRIKQSDGDRASSHDQYQLTCTLAMQLIRNNVALIAALRYNDRLTRNRLQQIIVHDYLWAFVGVCGWSGVWGMRGERSVLTRKRRCWTSYSLPLSGWTSTLRSCSCLHRGATN